MGAGIVKSRLNWVRRGGWKQALMYSIEKGNNENKSMLETPIGNDTMW